MAGSLESVLASIPGLAGWTAQDQQNRMKERGDLQNAGALQNLLAQMQAKEKEKAFRGELAALGPGATQESLAQVAAKYAAPREVLQTQQQSLDRQATRDAALTAASQAQAARAAEAEAARAARATESQLNRDAREREIKDRLAASTATAQDRQALMRELAGIRGDAAKEAAARRKEAEEEKGIEGAITKTSMRMKDVMPVYTAAKQLNDVLGKFTPEDVPGLGYAKNMEAGKMFLSQEGKDVSSSVKLLGNSILKAMSGAAVTPSEEVRQMAATMADGRFSAKDFYIAWPKISEWVNDQVSLGTASLTPPARAAFEERTGMKMDRITPRFQTSYDGGKLNLKDTRAPAAPAIPPPPAGFVVNK